MARLIITGLWQPVVTVRPNKQSFFSDFIWQHAVAQTLPDGFFSRVLKYSAELIYVFIVLILWAMEIDLLVKKFLCNSGVVVNPLITPRFCWTRETLCSQVPPRFCWTRETFALRFWLFSTGSLLPFCFQTASVWKTVHCIRGSWDSMTPTRF